MKKIITLLSIVTAGFSLSPMNADARSPINDHLRRPASVVYVSGYTTSGSPIYMKKVFSHYDRYGRAVYTYHRHFVNRRDHRRDHRNVVIRRDHRTHSGCWTSPHRRY